MSEKYPSIPHRLLHWVIMTFAIGLITNQATLQNNADIVFMSDRDGNREIYTMNADGRELQRLTYNDAQDLQPVWSPDKTQIAFTSNRDGKFAIYVMNADGSNQRKISIDDFAYHEYPSWSPDGHYLAYSSDRTGNFDIYIINITDGDPRRLTNNETDDSEPAWSPEGHQIAYLQQGDEGSEIFLISVNGGSVQQLTQVGRGDYFSPCWSPDGRQLAYAVTIFDRAGNNSEVYLRDMATGEERLLISHENSFIQGLSWSEDGSTLAYQMQENQSKWIIYRVSTNDGTFQVLTHQSYNSESPSWSTPRSNNSFISDIAQPVEGRPGQIIFASGQSGGSDRLFIMNSDGTDQRLFSYVTAEGSQKDWFPWYSPDGSRVAFISDRSGQAELYVMNADGTELFQLSNIGISRFNWSPASSEIIFQSGSESNSELYIVNVITGDTRRLTNNTLYDGYPAWSPDINQIAIVQCYDSRDQSCHIAIMQINSGNLYFVTHPSIDTGDFKPVWSPDGQQILFASYRNDLGGMANSDLFVINADGTNLRQLTFNMARDFTAQWSHDGRSIVFASDQDDANFEIYIMRSDGSNLTWLTFNSVWDGYPSPRP